MRIGIARGRRLVAMGLGAAVVAGLFATPAASGPEESKPAAAEDESEEQREPSVPVTPVKAKPMEPDRTEELSVGEPPDVAWPEGGTATVTLGPDGVEVGQRTQAGDLPVSLGGVDDVGAADGADAAAEVEFEVELQPRKAAADEGVTGLMLSVRPEDAKVGDVDTEIAVDYSEFAHAFGGDWASRLRFVEIPECDDCAMTILPTHHDADEEVVSADLTVAASGTTVVLSAGESGPNGDYSATSLSPVGEWEVAANSGSFSWGYSMEVPDVPGGLKPNVGLSYSSAAVDGRIATTNNQTSVVGEGWSDVGQGFIERSFRSCVDDSSTPRMGDLCWYNENATLSLDGRSSELVRMSGREYRLKNDDGTRIVQKLNSSNNGDVRRESWEVTTPDGTRYRFGSRPQSDSTWTVPVFGNGPGDGCSNTSSCPRAWRWNLDYVVDANGNEITYEYVREMNKYDHNRARGATAEYTRGGYLKRIEYGSRAGESSQPLARVDFRMVERCASGATTCPEEDKNYPDTPIDLKCTSDHDCEGNWSPTFWTTKRLKSVTTSVIVDGRPDEVDRWTLTHSYPDPGDSDASLWLHKVTHTGLVHDSESTPPVTFPADEAFHNRVNPPSDGRSWMTRYRVTNIRNESGGEINVKYRRNCTDSSRPDPTTNTSRCFPVKWTPQGHEDPVTDYFHKYVVDHVVENDTVGGNRKMETHYEYHGGGAWRYYNNKVTPAKYRTWSIWRGYEKVTVTQGSGDDGPVMETKYQYFRGMHNDRASESDPDRRKTVRITAEEGDPLYDHDQYAGFLREEMTLADGEEVEATINDPWRRRTAGSGRLTAYQVETGATHNRVALPGDENWQRSSVTYTYDPDKHGRVTQIRDEADDTELRCTRMDYAQNEAKWLLDLPSETTVATTCSDSPGNDALISRTWTSYDGRARGETPTKGNPTKEEARQYVPGNPPRVGRITTSETTYDSYGRVIETKDALGRATQTRYFPETGRATRMTETNALGHTTTKLLDVRRGQPTTIQEPNGRKTELSYDPLGRLLTVWLPGRLRNQDPSMRFEYGVRNNDATWVKSERLTPNETYATSYALFDGFLRERQTQTPSASGSGRVLEDTLYNSRGLASKTNHLYNDEGPPGTELYSARDNEVYRQTRTHHDGAGREVRFERRTVNGELVWKRLTEYEGDRVHVEPPEGGTATTTVHDARGRKTELHQYHGPRPGPADVTRYTYTQAGQQETITGPDGSRWEYTYDLLGRQIRAVDPDSGESTMTYDDAGQVLTRTDARGVTLAYEYDDLGRKTARYEDSTDEGDKLAEWVYDQLPGGGIAGIGMLTASTRFHEDGQYTAAVTQADAQGRPTESVATVDQGLVGDLAGSYRTTFDYWPDGSLRSTRHPGGYYLPSERVYRDYDDMGLLETTRGRSNYADGTVYTPMGELEEVVSFASSGDIVRERAYEVDTRRTERSHVRQSQDDWLVSIEDYHYEYDDAGNITEIVDLPYGDSKDSQCFEYDYLRRLTQAWTPSNDDCGGTPSAGGIGGPAPYWVSYEYNEGGNRTLETQHAIASSGADTVRTYNYPSTSAPQPHAVSSVETTGPTGSRTDTFDYDGSGKTIAREVDGTDEVLEWNSEGRVSSITSDSGTTSFVYDADGERVVKQDPQATTLYLGAQEIRLDHDADQPEGTRYYTHGGETVAVRTGWSDLSFTSGDHHETATLAVDKASGDVTRRRFDPFGNPRGPRPDAWPGQRGFVGGTEDENTGLTHLGARDYDPSTGSFLSVDPILDAADPQQMNGFAYASNAPTNLSDPNGLLACGGQQMIDGTTCPGSPEDPGPPPGRDPEPGGTPPSGNGPPPRVGPPPGHPCSDPAVCSPSWGYYLIHVAYRPEPECPDPDIPCMRPATDDAQISSEIPLPIESTSDILSLSHQSQSRPGRPAIVDGAINFFSFRSSGDGIGPAALKSAYVTGITAANTTLATAACVPLGPGAAVCGAAIGHYTSESAQHRVSDEGQGRYFDRAGEFLEETAGHTMDGATSPILCTAIGKLC